MRHLRTTFFFLAVALTLGGCGIFGGSDGSSVAIAEDVEAQSTPNTVQQVPAQAPDTDTGQESVPADSGDSAPADAGDSAPADAALPTAVTLPTAAPEPEPTVDRSQPTSYVVQSGDVLGLIAERFDADIAELRRVNNLDGNLIRVGQELTIPAADGSTETAADDTTESAAPAEAATSAPAPSSSSSPPAAPVSCNSAATGHCIQPGESLLGIAIKYDVTEEALRAANPGISGDLIKSGQTLNLPGGTTTTTTDPVATAIPVAAATAGPVPTVGPTDDAGCAANNPQFPYFHAADGLCYANPIGPTVVPTSSSSQAAIDGTDEDCRAGYFLWNDGLCYPIPGVTVTATPEPTSTSGSTTGRPQEDYGRPPCREGYVVLVATNRCWPEATNTSPATVTPVPAATSTGTTGGSNNVACTEPNFVSDAAGNCFLTQDGVDAGCEIINKQPVCSA